MNLQGTRMNFQGTRMNLQGLKNNPLFFPRAKINRNE